MFQVMTDIIVEVLVPHEVVADIAAVLDLREEEEGDKKPVSVGGLMLQGIATSIDALSVGFTIAYYDLAAAVLEALIIGVVTFIICIAGLKIGKKIGTSLSGKASVLGGLILIFIGAEIFIKGMFFS